MNSKSAIQTFTGVFVDVFNPDPNEIAIEDIAHALANQCRFSGHTNPRWSVASHCLLVCGLLAEQHKLAGLLHDGAEAYLVDLPRPIKRHPSMSIYRELDAMTEFVIASKYGVEYPWNEAVHYADRIAIWAEADLFMHGTDDWEEYRPQIHHRDDVAHAKALIAELIHFDPEAMFLKQFKVLSGGDVHSIETTASRQVSETEQAGSSDGFNSVPVLGLARREGDA